MSRFATPPPVERRSLVYATVPTSSPAFVAPSPTILLPTSSPGGQAFYALVTPVSTGLPSTSPSTGRLSRSRRNMPDEYSETDSIRGRYRESRWRMHDEPLYSPVSDAGSYNGRALRSRPRNRNRHSASLRGSRRRDRDERRRASDEEETPCRRRRESDAVERKRGRRDADDDSESDSGNRTMKRTRRVLAKAEFGEAGAQSTAVGDRSTQTDNGGVPAGSGEARRESPRARRAPDVTQDALAALLSPPAVPYMPPVMGPFLMTSPLIGAAPIMSSGDATMPWGAQSSYAPPSLNETAAPSLVLPLGSAPADPALTEVVGTAISEMADVQSKLERVIIKMRLHDTLMDIRSRYPRDRWVPDEGHATDISSEARRAQEERDEERRKNRKQRDRDREEKRRKKQEERERRQAERARASAEPPASEPRYVEREMPSTGGDEALRTELERVRAELRAEQERSDDLNARMAATQAHAEEQAAALERARAELAETQAALAQARREGASATQAATAAGGAAEAAAVAAEAAASAAAREWRGTAVEQMAELTALLREHLGTYLMDISGAVTPLPANLLGVIEAEAKQEPAAAAVVASERVRVALEPVVSSLEALGAMALEGRATPQRPKPPPPVEKPKEGAE